MGDNYKDLEELARSTTEDYYELLTVPFEAEESVIKRAYRKASIQYHPDKNPDNKDAADRFIALGWARDILIDPKLKGEYDRARTRRREKAFQDELLSGNRRKMKEELERRERESADFGASLKRKRASDLSEMERREQEIMRLAEDGKTRRKEAQERKDRARMDEEVAVAAAAEPIKSPEPQAARPGESAELYRTVNIRFHREGETAMWDKDAVRRMFEKYGKIDSIIIMGKDNKLKLEGEKHRKLVPMVFVVYGRLDHAHAAV
jgi:DnaJ family protein C protein 17